MTIRRLPVAAAALSQLLALAVPLAAQGPDGRWPLQPTSDIDRVVAPFMEGWYENEDGTYSISFGYLNMNDYVVEIPVGEDNWLEPAEYDGAQPTHFLPGHHRGVFAVTIPAAARDQDVWWRIRNENGEVTEVPGRTTAHAYQLDWFPRPHGSVVPRVYFGDDDELGRGPPGLWADETLEASVGEPVTVSINVREVSERDADDPRFREVVPLRVVWRKHQGPVGSTVEFTPHPSTAELQEPDPDADDEEPEESDPNEIEIPREDALVRVIATFSDPGEYVLLARVDNFDAPDSSDGNQCCWTNGYVTVTVEP